jgi:hypothetical protein
MRLLADIGHKYKPDMVVMSLDLTDFYDEHKYIRMIRFPRLSPTAFLLREAGLSWLIADWVGWSELRGDHHELPFPNTFYIVRQPLAESRPYLHEIETNLRRIEDHTRGVLEAKFVLVLLPRAFQYTDAEAPHDPHRNLYPPLGPYVLEPNRWFDEFCAETGFTCFSLLDDFRNSPVFPTCFENDPHWNVPGTRSPPKPSPRTFGTCSDAGRSVFGTFFPDSSRGIVGILFIFGPITSPRAGRQPCGFANVWSRLPRSLVDDVSGCLAIGP